MIQRIGALAVFMGLVLMLAIPVMADEHTPNQVGYWCEMGEKFDGVDAQSFVVPEPPDGYVIGPVVVVKAGSEQSTENPHAEFYGVEPGDTLVHPSGKDISHVIVCYQPEGTTTTTEPETTTTTVVITTTTDTLVITGFPVWAAGCDVNGDYVVGFDNGSEANEAATVDFISDTIGEFDVPVPGGGTVKYIVPAGEEYIGQAFDADFDVLAEISGTAEECTVVTTTTAPPTTTTAPPTTTTAPPTDSTLPVTGPEDYTGTAAVAGGLMLAGAAALAAGRFAQADE